MSTQPPTKGAVSTITFISIEWRFLLFGLLMAFWSSLGQTFFISLFSNQIRTALDLSHGAFGSYYAAATTASAISLLWLGKLADTMRLERLAMMIIGLLCTAAMLFSQISTVWMLVGGLYLLRMFGQGMMTHIYTTAMARRYVVARGRAISIAQLGHTASESIGPAMIVALQAQFDWRHIWIGLPLLALITVVPFIQFLTRRTLLQDGEGRLTPSEARPATSRPPNRTLISAGHGKTGTRHWRRRDVLRDPAFWFAMIWLAAVPSFVLTGLLFHQIYLAETKGIPLSVWTANYVFYAVFAIIGALVVGQLIDRLSAKRIAAHTLLPNSLACLALWLGSAEISVPAFFIFFGLAIGMPHATNAALTAELYGTNHIGEIKAMFLPVGVFASALSPMLMGLMIDAGLGLDWLMGMNIALAFGAQMMAMMALHFRRVS